MLQSFGTQHSILWNKMDTRIAECIVQCTLSIPSTNMLSAFIYHRVNGEFNQNYRIFFFFFAFRFSFFAIAIRSIIKCSISFWWTGHQHTYTLHISTWMNRFHIAVNIYQICIIKAQTTNFTYLRKRIVSCKLV